MSCNQDRLAERVCLSEGSVVSMSTQKWIVEHLEFALKADTVEEMRYRIRAVITRLSISPGTPTSFDRIHEGGVDGD